LYLYKKGYNIISDDISVLNFNHPDKFYVEKGPAYLKLWLDVLKKFNIQYKSLQKLRDNINKFIYPVYQNVESSSVDNIFVIRNVNKTGIRQTELKGVDKFDMLIKNIYKAPFSKNTPFEKKTFIPLTQLANKVNMLKIERGQDKFYQEIIENQLNQLL